MDLYVEILPGLYVCVLIGVALVPLPAKRSSSDFRTLTIDLIFGKDGLEAIDVAVVESTGPSCQLFPSTALRQRVAEDVLAALALSNSSASIDAEMSERYHEVGFVITFEKPRPGHQDTLQFDSVQLQSVAGDTNFDG